MKRRSFFQATLAVLAATVSAASGKLQAAVIDVCAKIRPHRPGLKLPPTPKWNKMTDDIDAGEFVRQVHDYERGLLPPDMVLPRVGQIWETVGDCAIDFHSWPPVAGKTVHPHVVLMSLPYLPSFAIGQVSLEGGERVRICALDDANRPLQVSFIPLRYDQLHPVVGQEDQKSWQYVLTLRTAYTVCCPREETSFFQELFRLVRDV